MTLISILDRLKQEILPTAVQQRKFGPNNVKFIDFTTSHHKSSQDQFSSQTIFGDVLLETANKDTTIQKVVIKIQHPILLKCDSEVNEKGLAAQFYNELLFYSEIIPLLNEEDSLGVLKKYFPTFFCGVATRGEDLNQDILIFEDLQSLDFRLTPSRSFIDFHHIKLVLSSIAEFHSLSLVCRQKMPEKLKKLMAKIIETKWTEGRRGNDEFLSASCRRGILPLKNNPKYEERIKDILPLLEKSGLTMAKLVTPVEPLAVLCHGDLCRNNIFFKYDANGKPVEVKFFDLATIRYASPVIDLSFFLFMNSSPELRTNHWEEFLQIYLAAFRSNPNLNDRNIPSFNDLRQDFRRRGFYGYALSSFFLPMMLSNDLNYWSTLGKRTLEESIANGLARGGESATNYVVQIVKHMIDEGFDFRFISNFELL